MDWKTNDIKVLLLRNEALALMEQSEKLKSMKEINSYLNKKLKKKSIEIFNEQVYLTCKPII